MSFNTNQALIQGVDAHKNGRYEEAEKLYRLVLSAYPNNPDANHNLGLISVILNKIDEGLNYFKKALKANPKIEQFWLSYVETLIKENKLQKAKLSLGKARKIGVSNNIILNLNKKIISKIKNPTPSLSKLNTLLNYFQNNNFSEAESLALSLSKTFPDHPFAWKALAAILHETKRYEEALHLLRKNIALSPNDPESHNNLGLTLQKISKFWDAQDSFNKAIELKPDYAEAYNNLGNCLKEIKNFKEAEKFYCKAIELNPNLAEAYNNLAQIYDDSNRTQEAINCYAQAIKISPSMKAALYNLGILLKKGLNFHKTNRDINFSINRLLEFNGLFRPIEISKSIISLIKCDPSIKLILKDDFANTPLINLEKNIYCLSQNKIFLKLMSITPLQDLELENFLRKIRYKIILNISKITLKPEANDFLVALALQCYTNEYVYDETNNEKIALKKIDKKTEVNLLKGIQPSLFELAILGSYKPLYEYQWVNSLIINSENRLIFKRQIQEPQKENEFTNQILKLNDISNETSLKVKDQYEENPYPRWVHTGLFYSPVSISEFAKMSELKLKNNSFAKIKNPKILIAGCGTGQHSIMASSRFKNSSVLAIDLSKKSLAYAKMKTEEFKIKNIEYKNADILDLENFKEKFDIIESSGVLHHMENPLFGWKILTKCLKAGGLMKIALYSEVARKHIVKTKKEIKNLKISCDLNGIKSMRKIIKSSNKVHHINIRAMGDFYSTSELRDLIFHIQEHRFTIPKIIKALDTLKLVFCGFENEKINKIFKSVYPGDDKLYDLNIWNDFEHDHPETFLGMYQFWCQKI